MKTDLEEAMRVSSENLKQKFAGGNGYQQQDIDIDAIATEVVEETLPPNEEKRQKRKTADKSAPGRPRQETPSSLKLSSLFNGQTYSIAAGLFFVSCLVERSSTQGSKYYNAAAPIAYLVMVSTASMFLLVLIISGRTRLMECLVRFLFLFPLCWLGAKLFLSIISA